jgi:branched-chain amino acid transport system substrate-binding protein
MLHLSRRDNLRTVALVLAAIFLRSTPAIAASNVTPYVVQAILPLTGSLAFAGQQELQTLRVIEKFVDAHGGILGHPLSFSVADDESNPAISVQLMQGFIQAKVPVVIGPALSSTCAAALPLLQNGPVSFCLSPGIHPPHDSFMFSLSVTTNDEVAAFFRYARQRGWSKIAVITATDASGQVVDQAVAKALSASANTSVQLVDHQHFNATDVSVDAQMAHIKAQGPDALLAWSVGSAFGSLVRGINDVGLGIPILTSYGNMNTAQLRQYRDALPAELLFAAPLGMSVDGDPGPVRDAQRTYFNVLRASGVDPYGGTLVWESAMLLIYAVRHTGVAVGPGQLLAYIEKLRSWSGIQGVYDFSDPGKQALVDTAVAIYRWQNGTATFARLNTPRR